MRNSVKSYILAKIDILMTFRATYNSSDDLADLLININVLIVSEGIAFTKKCVAQKSIFAPGAKNTKILKMTISRCRCQKCDFRDLDLKS